jgi:hypothetical protein
MRSLIVQRVEPTKSIRRDAYCRPPADNGLDTHWLREPVAFFPSGGTGRGVQAEVILSYRVTEMLTLGVGGRYWSMWTTNASQSCTGGLHCHARSETHVGRSSLHRQYPRDGMFAQLAYFYPPAHSRATGGKQDHPKHIHSFRPMLALRTLRTV